MAFHHWQTQGVVNPDQGPSSNITLELTIALSLLPQGQTWDLRDHTRAVSSHCHTPKTQFTSGEQNGRMEPSHVCPSYDGTLGVKQN
jgi:hypothetical protein